MKYEYHQLLQYAPPLIIIFFSCIILWVANRKFNGLQKTEWILIIITTLICLEAYVRGYRTYNGEIWAPFFKGGFVSVFWVLLLIALNKGIRGFLNKKTGIIYAFGVGIVSAQSYVALMYFHSASDVGPGHATGAGILLFFTPVYYLVVFVPAFIIALVLYSIFKRHYGFIKE